MLCPIQLTEQLKSKATNLQREINSHIPNLNDLEEIPNTKLNSLEVNTKKITQFKTKITPKN